MADDLVHALSIDNSDSLPDDQPDRELMHTFPVELLWFFQFQSQIKQTKGWDYAQPQGYTPDKAQMVLGTYQDQDHRNQGGDNICKVDLEIGEHNEPPIPMSFLQFACVFRSCDRSGRIFSTNSNSQEETISRQGSEQAVLAAIQAVRTSTQGAKYDQNYR